jgi:class 3 adenylate cyclase
MSEPASATAPAPTLLSRGPSLSGLITGMLSAVAVAALAWVPGAGEAAGVFSDTDVKAAPEVTFGIAALAGVGGAWVGWALDSWKRRLVLLIAGLALAGTQSALLARNFDVAWEPFSLAAALCAGLVTSGLLTPRGAGVERFFHGRLARAQVQRLSAAQSWEFLLPDEREAAVLTCRMLNETALREQMSAREFLKLMEAFRDKSSQVLLEHGALLDAPESGMVRAFFGLPLAVENHADKAAVAGLALAEAMRQFAIVHMHRDRPPVECGIGITCGTLTAGVTGEVYSAAGDTVEQSRWLAALNAEYHTAILTDGAAHLTAGNTEDRPLEILNPPEGAAVEVYQLLATRGGLSREALARRDAFRDAVMLLRAGHAEDALIRFENAREGLIHEDSALERLAAQAEDQIERDGRKPPPPSRPRARFSPRRIARP